MTEDEFWRIMDATRLAAARIEDRPEALRSQLDELSSEAIATFHEHYLDQVERAYRWDLWGAAYVILGGCSDDSFDYFRDWLISEGRDVFEAALADPDSIAELDDVDDAELEELRYVAHEVFEAKTGEPLVGGPRDINADPAGEEWDEDDVESLYPNLAEKYA